MANFFLAALHFLLLHVLFMFQSDFTDAGGGQIHYLNTFMQTPVRLSCMTIFY